MAESSSDTASLQLRVATLEKQVAGLMATVTLMHQKMNLGAWKVPKPDQYLQDERDSHKERDNVAKPVPTSKASRTMPGAAPTRTAVESATKVPGDLKLLEPFHYSPLNAAASEIRIVSIVESKMPDDPIECEMMVISLLDSPYTIGTQNFMPLSYTWGGLEKTKTISMNGKSFKITKNLYLALKHFRNAESQSLHPPGYGAHRLPKGFMDHWWIDAISINQDDLDERKNQVALMTRLYRMALIAHVWLGEEADDSSHAMELLKRLSRVATDQEQRDFVGRKPGQTHMFKGPGTIPEKIANEPAPLPDGERRRNYQALKQLFKRDWFSRVWILQEIALPQSVSVHCGSQVCSWDQMTRATSLLVYLADEYRIKSLEQPVLASEGSVASIFQRAESLMRLRQLTTSRLQSRNPYLSFTIALLYAKSSQATDQRDKVFAILPLVSPESTTLTADYRKSRNEVYTKTALDLSMTSLDFLSACQYTEGAISDLPSWVPNFSQPWMYYPMLMTLVPKDSKQDRSSATVAKYQPDDAALMVQGYIVDTLTITKDLAVTAESSKADVEAAKSDWETFVCEKDTDRSYKSKALDDLRYHSSGSGMYWPLYKTAYVGGKGEQYDLSIRAFNRQIATTAEDIELNRSDKMGWYRNFFTGRRIALSQEQHAGIVPAAAKPGDKVCKLNGCEFEFILRESSPDRWIVIGDSYFLGNFSHYHISSMRHVPKLQDIVLI